MNTFLQWLNEEDTDNRPTTHRTFSSTALFPPKPDNLIADNEKLAYRLTKQPQIDDIMQSGMVRARLGKMRGGKSGETQWSLGSKGFSYTPQSVGTYLLVANAENLDNRNGPMPKEELVAVYSSNGEKWINITRDFK